VNCAGDEAGRRRKREAGRRMIERSDRSREQREDCIGYLSVVDDY